ncbi:hypothetical protein N7509_013254 [Penicillium cosmopolitanum]|uniref:Uncharacterized protein n=1 Tax=Penicillium cosmopolitanum TaxID=1131564 RepID=A0A9W9SD12_9EURO|nr:uncharacterized protein N7509_013254 [Penicillium cosmopolitanum]KAJ5376368.1 hypothetical protein N7509_013254 [Penicillium cosmopolitanum]
MVYNLYALSISLHQWWYSVQLRSDPSLRSSVYGVGQVAMAMAKDKGKAEIRPDDKKSAFGPAGRAV